MSTNKRLQPKDNKTKNIAEQQNHLSYLLKIFYGIDEIEKDTIKQLFVTDNFKTLQWRTFLCMINMKGKVHIRLD